MYRYELAKAHRLMIAKVYKMVYIQGMRWFSIVAAILLVDGCQLMNVAPIGWDYEGFSHPETFQTISDITLWTSSNIKGIDAGMGLIWQDPSETYSKRSGDCKAYVILAMYFSHEAGIDTRMVILSDHAIMRIVATGQLIDPQTPDGHLGHPGAILSEISYEDAMWIAKERASQR